MSVRLRLRLTAIALFGLLTACAGESQRAQTASDSGIDIAGIIIRNSLDYSVKNVIVQVPATGRFAGCGNIHPRTECKTSFPAIGYRKNGLLVTWLEHGEAKATDEFVVEPPAGSKPGDSLWLEVVIYSAGLAGARLVQP
jgi:hypothetical protein